MNQLRKNYLEKQGYRLVGNHSAIKICHWTKRSLIDEDVCYKKTFYGINSWRCIQVSVSLDICSLRCQWCWRDLENTSLNFSSKINKPKKIVDDCIKEQIKILQGFKSNKKLNKKKFEEAIKPKHFTISLSGEGTFYPYLPELIDEINNRGMTTFLVTNGTNPEMLKKLLDHKPTQIYVTLPAPNKKLFEKNCKPLTKNAWEKINESLKILEKFSRRTIRLTLAKGINLIYPEQYAELLKNIKFDFLELKAAISVGYARQRITYEQVPSHEEIKEFAKVISEELKIPIVDEKKESRVVLISKVQDRKIQP